MEMCLYTQQCFYIIQDFPYMDFIVALSIKSGAFFHLGF